MKSLLVVGRRWFNRRCGHSYYSAQIIVDGVGIHTIPYASGYGDHYLQAAREWLDANGHLPGIKNKPGTPGEALWRYCERMGIGFTYSVADVARKKDL